MVLHIVKTVTGYEQWGAYEGVAYGVANTAYKLYFWSDGIVTWTATR